MGNQENHPHPPKEKRVRSEWNEVWIDTTFCTKNNFYHISNYGRIRSTHKATGNEYLINGSMSGGTMLMLNVIQPDGSRGCCSVPRFVAENFIDKPSEEHIRVIHIDEDYSNNKWTNLKWVTKEEWYEFYQNSQVYKEGRKKLMKKIYKLNLTQVRLIKKRFKTGKIKRRTLAKQFGVSMRTITRIGASDYWNGVKIEEDEN